MPIYLDCNATTPIEPRVAEEVQRFFIDEYGNAGSRTHEFGNRAKVAVQRAREQVARVVEASPDEVIFTSGATESNNLAILGLATHGQANGRMHFVSTMIEHKAVLEPLEALTDRGFTVTLVPPERNGAVDPQRVRGAVRDETLLVSVMQANNETGVRQPIQQIAELLGDHPAYFHVDAAQGFGKDLAPLRAKRIDLMSVSGHKIYAPKGVGALVARRRRFARIPLSPLMYGGGQERGLRPGTLPVPLIVGLGVAARLAIEENDARRYACQRFREHVVQALRALDANLHGDQELALPHVVNASIPGLDSEAVMLALKDLVAISNGSACTSQSYEPSHVLSAMALTEQEVRGALRISWCHLTQDLDWHEFLRQVQVLR
jgi:cysteine desulfurase